jgi:hypothetical protein
VRSSFSRPFVIVLSLGAALMRAQQKAWPDAMGLFTLGLGLLLLRLNETRNQPLLKRAAWVCFGITLLAMGIVYQRDYAR